jgi:2-polyprenyl-3-methyl-5-hydroxy-6-metoxy-1,4-benzoquinol methylase
MTQLLFKNIAPVDDNLIHYLNLINPAFDCVTNKRILEIGPGQGRHTDLMLSKSPASLTVVEPDIFACEYLTNTFENIDIVNDDAFSYISHKNQYDVVVACGLIYHFHSPFYFLEQVVNNIGPDTFIIENPANFNIEHAELSCALTRENVDEIGQRVTINNYKAVNFNITIAHTILEQAMNDLGYDLTTTINYDEDCSFKQTLSMYVFTKKK